MVLAVKLMVRHLLQPSLMSKLFQPLKIKSVSLGNRIAVSPMCQYSSKDGFANDWHLVHLGSRAVGGAGLVIAEATAVSPEGRITPNDLGIWKDDHISELKKITSFIKSQGSVPGIQLAHAGRKASHHVPWEGGAQLKANEGIWETVAPSALAFKESEPTPIELNQKGIDKVISDFELATERSLEAGFEVIEIHGAHGYLLHEFLSPLSNKRNDAYGGNFENRTRFILDLVKAIRRKWNTDRPLFFRISATDWVENGWNIDDSIRLCSLLKENDIDLIDCSSGGNIPGVKIPTGPMYQVPFSKQIRKKAQIKTGAVGMITTSAEAEKIIQSQQADLIIMARQLLRDPYFPLHAAKELGVDQPWPVQYDRAKI
jgi:NADH:flavin oxidoreductases, Old Yellow Enzyme family